MLISWMFPVCCHNFIFSQVCGKDFLIYIERTHPHKMQLQIHFTDSASQLTYLQKYHKQLFILSLKSHFLKCKHFSTDPPLHMWWGSFQDKSYLIIIGITRLIIMYFLWRYYFSKVYSLASFKKLNFSVFSVQKGNKVLFTKTLAMLRNGGCSLTLILTRNMLARIFDVSWYFFSLLGSVNIPVAFSIHPLLAAIPV